MDPARVAEISRMGGVAAQAKGTAHRWTTEKAREAGSMGGRAMQRKRRDAEAKASVPPPPTR